MNTISGIGQDSHRFIENGDEKPLILGGVLFEGTGLIANSDGDVVLHAITNAISGITTVNVLGTIADEMCNSGITDSAEYLRETLKYMTQKHMRLQHLSISIECKKPKITPKIEEMRKRIAAICGILPEQIGITATSGEELTEFGKGHGIAALCIVTAAAL